MAYKFEPMGDMARVRDTMTHPRIYPWMTDDFSPPREEFQPTVHPSVLYLGAFDADEYLGVWMFCPENSVCWAVHTCLLPSAWGRAVDAAIGAVAWIFSETQCRRIVTTVPSVNRLALRLAMGSGMTQYGVNPQSFLKNGELLDQILLGVSKPETLCQQ